MDAQKLENGGAIIILTAEELEALYHAHGNASTDEIAAFAMRREQKFERIKADKSVLSKFFFHFFRQLNRARNGEKFNYKDGYEEGDLKKMKGEE